MLAIFLLEPAEEIVINDFIAECHFTQFPVRIGRIELEEALIRHYHPKLNKKRVKKMTRNTLAEN